MLWIANDAVAPAPATSQAPRLKKVAAEPTPSSDATTPPRTAPRTPTSSRPACVGSQSGGIEHAIQPATTPKTTQAGEAHCACTFDDAGHETSVHSQDQVAPHDRRCGHLGPYGVRPISPPTRTPSDGSGRPVRRIPEPFPESKWVSEPISARPATEDTHDLHRTSDRISPMAQATPVWRWALWPRSCTLPAAGRGQRHPSHHRRHAGLTRTVPDR